MQLPDDVIAQVERRLDVGLDRSSRRTGAWGESAGHRTDRGTWVRVDSRPRSWIQPQSWVGAEAAYEEGQPMDHRLVQHIEKALGWAGPQAIGAAFGFGRMPDPSLCDQLLNPRKLLSLILRRSLTHPQLRCLQHGKDLHPSAYLTTTTTGRGQRIEVADMRGLGCLLREGATLVLDDIGALDATLEIACRALSWWAGEIHPRQRLPHHPRR